MFPIQIERSENFGKQYFSIEQDLHRTGSDHFIGENSEWNQALLKRVLVAYSKYNPQIGYCQGFNILAAVVLEVLEWDVEESLKVSS